MSFSHRNDRRASRGARAVLAFTFSAARMPATRKLTLVLVLAILPMIARAADITLQGTFTADDTIQLFSVSLAAPASVDIRSYGYAGGTTSTGTVVPRGGFDTILTLFSASGVFINDNDEGAGVAVDPTTGLAADARLTETLTPGNYIVALTEFDNFSIGNLSDGFAEAGNPHFTAAPSFTSAGPCPGNMFRDISGTAGRCRTGNWAVDFLNVASVAPVAVPEPSALLLAGVGLALLLVGRFRHWTKATVLAGALVATLAGVPARAQTSSGPDYSNVSDFLNGQRSLLQVTDLMVTMYDQNLGRVYSTPITTSNSQPTLGNQFGWSTQAQSSGPSYSALMWNGTDATTITVVNGDVNNAAQRPTLDLLFQTGTNTANWFSSSPLGLGSNPAIADGAAADFTGDGFDDLALSTDDGRLLIITATDVNNQNSGISLGATPVDTLGAIAAGDFKGDGNREIAGLAIQQDGSLKLEIYTVDPNSLTVTLASSITLTDAGSPVAHVSMARGRFATVNHDQLAIAFATNSGPAYVEVIDFTPNTLTPFEASAQLGSPAPNVPITPGFIQVKTGEFNLPGNSYDSIVYHSSSENTIGRFFEILTVDPTNYNVGGTVPVTYDQFPCAPGIQVGNFDHRQGSDPNLNSQIAFMYCNSTSDNSGNPGFSVNIYSVDPTTLNITESGQRIRSDGRACSGRV